MALGATIYRFQIKLSDVDRGIYEVLELRPAMHPSESVPFLLARVIAYCLNVQEGTQFTQGIANPDDPAIVVKDLTGAIQLWIDIGTPSAKRLHKAAKAAAQVKVYTHKDPSILQLETAGAEIFRRQSIEVFSLPSRFLEDLGDTLARDNAWDLISTDGELTIAADGKSFHCDVKKHSL